MSQDEDIRKDQLDKIKWDSLMIEEEQEELCWLCKKNPCECDKCSPDCKCCYCE
jgi:hypothetical protein